MIEYNGKQYTTKTKLIQALYDAGDVDMTPASKKALAERIGTSVPNVHVDLSKYIGTSKYSKQSTKENTNKTVTKNNLENFENKSGKYRIFFAPNPWGLPVNVEISMEEAKEGLANWNDETNESLIKDIIE